MRSASALADRVEATIRRHELIPPGGEITCLVSGGADSTCLWHVLGGLGYRVAAVHVNHGLRGAESDEDARFCADVLGAEIVGARLASPSPTEATLRDVRYELTAGRGLRATGHTASDQVETVLYRLVSSGTTKGIKPKREDGVVRPLLEIWRNDTVRYCEDYGLAFRTDSANASTKRGLIREEILPLLRRLHPGRRAESARAGRGAPAAPERARANARRAPRIERRDEGGRPRRRGACRPRVRRHPARGACALRPVAHRELAPWARRSHSAPRRPPRRTQQEGAGPLRRRESSEKRP